MDLSCKEGVKYNMALIIVYLIENTGAGLSRQGIFFVFVTVILPIIE